MPDTRPEPSRLYRWLVLIFLSLAMFGSYYAYDALSPLADVLKQQLGFSDDNLGFLQAIYSLPNIFTVVIGGFIIDRFGLRDPTQRVLHTASKATVRTATRAGRTFAATQKSQGPRAIHARPTAIIQPASVRTIVRTCPSLS